MTRALEGFTPGVAASLLVVCAWWAANRYGMQSLVEDGLAQTLKTFAADFAVRAAIFAVIVLPMLLVSNLGPQAGGQRLASLALVTLLGAFLAMVVRWAAGQLAGESALSFHAYASDNWRQHYTSYLETAAALTILFELHRRQTRSAEAMHRAEVDRLAFEREMEQARLQVLQAQIEPHFLFNTLANVRRLCQTHLAAGCDMLDNLMRYLEVALPRMRERRATLGGEVALIESFLEVQRIRMGRRLEYAIDVPEELRALEAPPMMLITLVENAIKHGLNPLPEGGRLALSARRDGRERLRIEVSDTGRGFHSTSGGGTGLANVRARLAAEHGVDAMLELVENQPRGVTAVLSLPAKTGTKDRA